MPIAGVDAVGVEFGIFTGVLGLTTVRDVWLDVTAWVVGVLVVGEEVETVGVTDGVTLALLVTVIRWADRC